MLEKHEESFMAETHQDLTLETLCITTNSLVNALKFQITRSVIVSPLFQ